MDIPELGQSQDNPNLLLKDLEFNTRNWVDSNTAILIVHGIGNQLPLETLDSFARGLIKEYQTTFNTSLSLTHELVAKSDENGGVWFDNVLRIKKSESECYIDLYEYYWANYSQNVATWNDLSKWLNGVVAGAKIFYEDSKIWELKKQTDSPFFNKKTGKFNSFKYWFFLVFASKIIVIGSFFRKLLIKVVTLLFGSLGSEMLQNFLNGKMHDLLNVIGEVSIYNVFDPKSKFYDTRRKILDNAVNAVKFLIEIKDKNECLCYPSLIIAGHSLGSEIAYDAINRINLLSNNNKLENYDNLGRCTLIKHSGKTLADQLNGFITFGSPLDKTAFFLRENVPNSEFVRQQFLDHYHGFKSGSLFKKIQKFPIKINTDLICLLESVKWRNYYDHKDYVSGCLDYYTGLTNIDCQFEAGLFGFTHGYYWETPNFYKDIITNFL
jgi:hypothetical protein